MHLRHYRIEREKKKNNNKKLIYIHQPVFPRITYMINIKIRKMITSLRELIEVKRSCFLWIDLHSIITLIRSLCPDFEIFFSFKKISILNSGGHFGVTINWIYDRVNWALRNFALDALTNHDSILCICEYPWAWCYQYFCWHIMAL